MKLPAWGWVALILAAVFSIWSYGNGRAAQALALARADSLNWAVARHDSLEGSRDSARTALASSILAFDRTRDSLATVAEVAGRRSRVNLARLEDVLNDSASVIPDTVRIVVMETIEGLETERNVCQAQLSTCEETRLRLESRIMLDSTSISEKDSLLGVYNVQLGDALKNRKRPGGPLRWLERGLAVFAIVTIVTGR